MTLEELRKNWEWGNTKPDMVDRVTREIFRNLSTIEACCGKLIPTSVIAWCAIEEEVPLCALNFSIRASLSDVEVSESVLAVPAY